jgi:hypothetical protein
MSHISYARRRQAARQALHDTFPTKPKEPPAVARCAYRAG